MYPVAPVFPVLMDISSPLVFVQYVVTVDQPTCVQKGVSKQVLRVSEIKSPIHKNVPIARTVGARILVLSVAIYLALFALVLVPSILRPAQFAGPVVSIVVLWDLSSRASCVLGPTFPIPKLVKHAKVVCPILALQENIERALSAMALLLRTRKLVQVVVMVETTIFVLLVPSR